MAPMSRSLPLFSVSSLLCIACAYTTPQRSSSPIENITWVPGRTEFKNEKTKEVGPGIGLATVEAFELPAEYARKISGFYPYFGGLMSFRGGECLVLVRDQQDRNHQPDQDISGARIVSDPSLCGNAPEKLAASPCSNNAQQSPVGEWRLKCKRLAGNRSVLIAVAKSPKKGREITLTSLDQNVAFVGIFQLHDRVEIKTLGHRSDGKTVIATFLWHPAATR